MTPIAISNDATDQTQHGSSIQKASTRKSPLPGLLTEPCAVTAVAAGPGASPMPLHLSQLVQFDKSQNAQPLIALRKPAVISVPLAFRVTIRVSLATRCLVANDCDALITREIRIGIPRA